ncbi:MAG TPA: enoyl-CoA hydratase-related protein [Acidobacteriaceae bacterium]|jgi:methylglutaconyl-CoA hydratase|nr:enoyl-CoA hydratase-related protein [Acidobacteriaceae bacterium]
MTHYSTLSLHSDAGIHTILLNRPDKRNALTPQLISDLTQALEAAAANRHCQVVIVSGAGSSFCAGLDLEHLRAMSAGAASDPHFAATCRADAENIAVLLRTLYTLPKPTIAAVNGPAIAGGMGIATLCDFTLAVPEAKFGYTEVRIGFVPAIVSAFLRTQIGDKQCRDLVLTGRLIDAAEAASLGLVTRIVREPELMREARALAHRLSRNSPAAMEATKRLLTRYTDRFLPDDIEAAILTNVQSRTTEDFREGIRAFLEKREPEWPSIERTPEAVDHH